MGTLNVLVHGFAMFPGLKRRPWRYLHDCSSLDKHARTLPLMSPSPPLWLQIGDFVLAPHPEYVDTYAPGIVAHVEVHALQFELRVPTAIFCCVCTAQCEICTACRARRLVLVAHTTLKNRET